MPKTFVSIPRLELTGATLSMKVASLLKKELDLDGIQERFWADSKQVLGYIIDDVWQFKTFVANKLQQMKYYIRSMMLHSN